MHENDVEAPVEPAQPEPEPEPAQPGQPDGEPQEDVGAPEE